MTDGRVRSGKATSEAMTAEQKTARAKAGAAKRAELAAIPKATHKGELKIGDSILPCFVLEDGRRVLSGRGLQESLRLVDDSKSGAKLDRLFENKSLNPFLKNELGAAHFSPIICLADGKKISGYEATILSDLCDAVLEARKSGAVTTSRLKIVADQSEMLMRGFARVGLIALVDEATGYQAAREKDALAKILEAFVAKELRPWMKTFPNAYYEEIFRLYKLPYPPVNNKNWKPSFIGTLTNNVVYERLAPDILPELKKAASKAEKKARLHQWLTDDIGHPKLREHLASIVTLLKLSSTPQDFKDKVDRIHPAFGQTYTMDFE
ncbi:MAG: oxygenase [Gammaproteobacteria bacterium 28-57-27]|nr:MAG: oxygenase [Gammaproteobacteria bacterium 28-57-27]